MLDGAAVKALPFWTLQPNESPYGNAGSRRAPGLSFPANSRCPNWKATKSNNTSVLQLLRLLHHHTMIWEKRKRHFQLHIHIAPWTMWQSVWIGNGSRVFIIIVIVCIINLRGKSNSKHHGVLPLHPRQQQQVNINSNHQVILVTIVDAIRAFTSMYPTQMLRYEQVSPISKRPSCGTCCLSVLRRKGLRVLKISMCTR